MSMLSPGAVSDFISRMIRISPGLIVRSSSSEVSDRPPKAGEAKFASPFASTWYTLPAYGPATAAAVERFRRIFGTVHVDADPDVQPGVAVDDVEAAAALHRVVAVAAHKDVAVPKSAFASPKSVTRALPNHSRRPSIRSMPAWRQQVVREIEDRVAGRQPPRARRRRGCRRTSIPRAPPSGRTGRAGFVADDRSWSRVSAISAPMSYLPLAQSKPNMPSKRWMPGPVSAMSSPDSRS